MDILLKPLILLAIQKTARGCKDSGQDKQRQDSFSMFYQKNRSTIFNYQQLPQKYNQVSS